MSENPFKFLNKLHEDMKINDAYDKEMQRLRENRTRYNSFVKEREIKINQEKKRKNSGE